MDYCRRLFDRFSSYPQNFDITFSLLAPFLDPGSPAFRSPEEYGYRLFTRTLADHREAMRQLHWRDVLGYETTAMTARRNLPTWRWRPQRRCPRDAKISDH